MAEAALSAAQSAVRLDVADPAWSWWLSSTPAGSRGSPVWTTPEPTTRPSPPPSWRQRPAARHRRPARPPARRRRRRGGRRRAGPGAGMADWERSFADGYSTADRIPGPGPAPSPGWPPRSPAARRPAGARSSVPGSAHPAIRAVARRAPCRGERVNGDAWSWSSTIPASSPSSPTASATGRRGRRGAGRRRSGRTRPRRAPRRPAADPRPAPRLPGRCRDRGPAAAPRRRRGHELLVAGVGNVAAAVVAPTARCGGR